MKIGVISDTHLPNRARKLPKSVWNAFQDVDLIIHAGDVNASYVLEDLELLAPVKAVRGNTDNFIELKNVPRSLVFEFCGYRIGVVHGDGGKTAYNRAITAFADVELDVVIFGHSHEALLEKRGKTIYLNPGSPTNKRMAAQYSFGILSIDENGIHPEIRYFDED
ncbi:MAG: metallophosphoesterase family protein [Clostridia bacterium]